MNALRFYCMGMDTKIRDSKKEITDSEDTDLLNLKSNGALLYLGIPLSQITGVYRFLNFKNF